MISDGISDNIPPQVKILNFVIPILMHFCSFVSNWNVARGMSSSKCDEINDVKLFPLVNCLMHSRKFFRLSNQMSDYISKCITD